MKDINGRRSSLHNIKSKQFCLQNNYNSGDLKGHLHNYSFGKKELPKIQDSTKSANQLTEKRNIIALNTISDDLSEDEKNLKWNESTNPSKLKEVRLTVPEEDLEDDQCPSSDINFSSPGMQFD
jgi:hypothetical protein